MHVLSALHLSMHEFMVAALTLLVMAADESFPQETE